MTALIDEASGRGGLADYRRPVDAYRTDWARLPREDRMEILKLQALWTAVVRAGRPDRAAEFCAEDVVMLPPEGPPINGREAVRAWLRESASGLGGANAGPIERIEVAGVDVRGGSRSAWLTATVTTYRATPSEASNGDVAAQPERERRLWALVKDGAVWRVRLAGWEQPPEPAEAADEACETEDVPDAPTPAKAPEKRWFARWFGRKTRR